MSEVVPLPSFGEVFFDARGQERCLRVTWHEGTLVLSLWRGEMCTASFRMPMEDVGRLLDTLDEGFAEATGEQPAVPAPEPGTEVMPGTGTYHRPGQHGQQPGRQHAPQTGAQQPQLPGRPQLDERPTAALSPSDVLVARGTPAAHQDKLVASYGETTAPRDPGYAEPAAGRGDYADPARDSTPAYGEPRNLFTGPQYVDSTGPQQKYTGDPYSGPQYASDPLSGPHQYGQDPLSGPHSYAQQVQPEPFTGPQYVDNEPVYQMPGSDQRRQAPLSTDPLGFPSQAADRYQAAGDYPSDPYGGRRPDAYQQQPPQVAQPQAPAQPSTAGLGTPMHGIPGAGRRRGAPQPPQPAPVHDDYGSYQNPQQPNPVDPLMTLGRPDQQYPPASGQHPGQEDLSRPYVGDPMFSTGERLRPDQPDYHERSDRREW
ncbi:hypothetical protein AB0M50_26800 [Nonomuraea fuscirosea]|uniref:hypothetical protein n=1 Tax=Nonomuraea fuscirosea TaxID=1291556 RepID=UPI002DDC6F73|nr:hypothetical protein [Nonomuraea fuscirosea]WSA54649.1 hypothetical protein OIE67_08500 [Nonomuraea fuscirosea]